jgi:hypothetical protein
MKKLCAFLLLGFGATTTLAACGDDGGVVSLRKGAVDEAEVSTGVTVTLSGRNGTVRVPFVEPVPNVADEDFEEELQGAVSLSVVSAASGSSADLTTGTLVSDSPSGPGEWSWTFNEDRDEATLTFFNESASGLTLKPQNSYSATLTIATNAYVERLPGFAFQVTVTGG